MNDIYNIILNIGEFIFTFIFKLNIIPPKSKFKKFIEGQNNLLANIQNEIPDSITNVIWIHASSLGEYGVARPIIKKLKEEKGYTIIVTFFSPTGYEALEHHHPNVDHVFYLPLDTSKNVYAFLDIIRPQKAIFIISEYWLNYLSELKKREIPTYLISAIIKDNAPFFKWYGNMFKKSLNTFTHFMVLNKKSESNLNKLGYFNVSLTGDPLFDNAIAVASTPWKDDIIEGFAGQRDLFIAGSISDKKDIDLICSLANKFRDIHFVIIPHEITEEMLNQIKCNLDGNTMYYSECDADTDFSSTQILIVDCLGVLAYLYRYGKWAYVGGGFTPYLHSIIEATVYGLPVAFGPMIHRKVTPHQLIELGIGNIVRSASDIQKWFETIKDNPDKIKEIKDIALNYTQNNSGATSVIVNLLEK